MSSSTTFRRQLVAALGRTPWWLVSLVFHTVLLHAFFLIPVAPFVEETASLRAWAPKTVLMAWVSQTSPWGVAVPWALM